MSSSSHRPAAPPPVFSASGPTTPPFSRPLAILRANDDISQVHVDNTFNGQVIYWRWQTDPTSFRRYAFHVQNNIVTRPVLPSSITLGELQLALGDPEVVTAALTNEYVQQPAFIF